MTQGRSPDELLMLFGMVRFALWLFVALEARRLRVVLPFASRMAGFGALLLAVNAIVFSFYNAHYTTPQWIVDWTVLASTPGVAATTTGCALIFRYVVGSRRRLEAGLPTDLIADGTGGDRAAA